MNKIKITMTNLNHGNSHLNLSKGSSELIASRLSKKTLQLPHGRILFYEETFEYFREDNGFVSWDDIEYLENYFLYSIKSFYPC